MGRKRSRSRARLVAGDLAQAAVRAVGNESVDGAGQVVAQLRGAVDAVAAIKAAANGDGPVAARAVARGALSAAEPKIAAVASGAAAAAAGTIAYAGVGGTLLKLGVVIGVCSPPALVVVAPIAAAAGVYAGIRGLRRLLS